MKDNELKALHPGQILVKTFKHSFSCLFNHLPTHIVFGLLYLTAIILFIGLPAGAMIVTNFPGLYALGYMGPEALSVLITLLIYLVTFPVTLFWYMTVYNMQIKKVLNEKWSLGPSLKLAARKFFPLLFVNIICYIIPVAALFIFLRAVLQLYSTTLYIGFIAGAALPAPFLICLAPLILHENRGPIAAIGRSIRLTAYSFFRIVGTLALFTAALLIVSLFPAALLKLSSVALYALGDEIQFFGLIVIGLLLLPLLPYTYIAMMTFSTLIYFNQKVKYENFGVEEVFAKAMEMTDSTDDDEGSNNKPPQYYS